jgi:hypothetical protein
MKENGFHIKIPGGNATKEKDWYPFVNVFNASSGFSKFIGRDVDLTILYNFGAFNGKSSSIYDENSPYFSAFYGAYAIRNNENDERYGFDEKEIDINEIVDVSLYDYIYLVLYGFGCNDPVFSPISYDIVENVEYLGYNDWVQVDAIIETNSPAHKFDGRKTSYIQYGKPIETDKEDFLFMNIHGRMYVRYFEEYDTTIIMYVMAKKKETIIRCDSNILRHTVIKDR